VTCIKSGDLAGFDNALLASEPEFVKRRVYLTLERGRDIALRNLLRRVFLAAGFEDSKEGQATKDRMRKTRLPIAHFAAALRMGTRGAGSGQVLDDDEVECLLANMIYKVCRSLRCLWVVATCNPNPPLSSVRSFADVLCGGLPSVALSEAIVPRSYSLATLVTNGNDLLLTTVTGFDEGLYLARPWHGGSEQEGRIPRDRGLMPKRLRPYCIPNFTGAEPDTITGQHHQHYQQLYNEVHMLCIHADFSCMEMQSSH
jgi:hypothetical protein